MATPNDALVEKLLTATTQVQRIADIDPSDFVFNFLNATRGTGQGGFVVAANVATFPALLTGNGAMAVGVLGPCGLNSPHTHPRATEIQIVTQGGPIQAAFAMENGAKVVQNTVPVGSATVFPKGSMHFQQNLGCETTVFVASFDFVDPGTLQIAQNLFSLDKGIVNATLGDIGVDIFANLNLPANVVLGAQSCLDRCGIDRSTFNFTSTFADYIAFSNSSWSVAPSLPASALPPTSSGPATNVAAFNLPGDGSVDIPFGQNPLGPAVIGLSVASGVLLLALAAALIFGRRRTNTRSVVPSKPFAVQTAGGYAYKSPYEDTETLDDRYSPEKH